MEKIKRILQPLKAEIEHFIDLYLTIQQPCHDDKESVLLTFRRRTSEKHIFLTSERIS